jgi:hypothetical protein
MRTEERKAARAAYRERKTVAGIYVLTCVPTGECWVGRAPDVETIENRIRFGLRHAATPHRGLQAAMRAYGEAGFRFEIVERLKDEDMDLGRERILKNRHAFWCERLKANAV